MWNAQLAGEGLEITILGGDTGSSWHGMMKKQREMMKPSTAELHGQCSPMVRRA